MGSDAMDGESDSNGLYFLLMIYRGCCLSHGKGGNYLFEHRSHGSHRFIKCHTENTESTENLIAMRIVRIERIFICPAEMAEWRKFYSHAETQRAQSFIRTRIERIYNSLSSRYWIYLSETLPISLFSYM